MTLNAYLTVADGDAGVPPRVDLHAVCEATEARDLVRDVLTRVGDKWTVLVISTLDDGPLRFTHLLDRVSGISHRMLTRTLRALERDGLVSRASYAEVPPRVEYSLTALGRSLNGPLEAIIGWVGQHQAEVQANRARFDG